MRPQRSVGGSGRVSLARDDHGGHDGHAGRDGHASHADAGGAIDASRCHAQPRVPCHRRACMRCVCCTSAGNSDVSSAGSTSTGHVSRTSGASSE